MSCASWVSELDHGALGRLDREEREADHLLRQLEGREGPLPRPRVEPPGALAGRGRGRVVDDLERAGDPELEPVARVAEPAHAAGADQPAHRAQRLAHEGHLARAERGTRGGDLAVAR